MTPNKVEELIRKWNDDGLTELSTVNRRLIHLEERLYKTYEPTKASRAQYLERLEEWLLSVEDEQQQQTLLKLAPEIFYIGPEEFIELYRSAYSGPISRWLIELEDIDICRSDAQKLLREAAKNTWFCPLSDSLRINSFYHVNDIASGANHRPDWRSLEKLGSKEKILCYCEKNKIKRIVILEDFVGGGSQASEALPFASALSSDLEIIFVPLIVCPTGADYCRSLCKLHTNLRFEPIIELPKRTFFNDSDTPFDEKFTAELRNLVQDTYTKVSGDTSMLNKPYGPYGYPPEKPVGGLIVMYSNTPDNSIPLIHWRPTTGTWSPLFPRHSRV